MLKILVKNPKGIGQMSVPKQIMTTSLALLFGAGGMGIVAKFDLNQILVSSISPDLSNFWAERHRMHVVPCRIFSKSP